MGLAALILETSSLSASAANIDITTAVTTAKTFSANNNILTIRSPSGNLTVAGASVRETSNTGNQVILESGIASNTGISSSGGSFSAIAVSGTAKMSNIAVNGGRITSDASGTTGTISLINSSVSTTTISTAVGTSITNTATAGYGINFGFNNNSNHILTLNNAGTISVNDNVSSTAINIISDNNNGSSYTLKNSGLITAGANGTALAFDAGSTSTVLLNNSGSGSVIGAITLTNNSSNTTITNNTTEAITGNITAGIANLTVNNLAGTITGNITATTANLDVNNSATMNGNIILGSNTSSTVALNGGELSGNITMNNTSQLVTFAGGNLNGTINGSGLVTANISTILNGNIGAATAISTLTVNSDSTLNAANNNSSLSAATINLNSAGILGSTLITGGGAVTANAINVNNSGGVGSTFNVGSGGVVIGAGHIYLATNSTLNLSTGSITTGSTGEIRGDTNNSGTVNFTDNNSLGVNLGNGTAGIDGNKSLLLTTITSNKVVNASIFNIDSQTITLNSGSQLNFTSGSLMSSITNINNGSILTLGSTASTSATTNISSGGTLILGSGALSGEVQGQSDGSGTVNFTENYTLTSAVGSSTNSLALVKISTGKAVASSTKSIYSTNVTLDAGSSLVFTSGSLTTLGGATTLGSGSTLTLGSGLLASSINGASSGTGALNFNNSNTLSITDSIGSIKSLDAINITDGAAITANGSIAANNVTIGRGVSGTLTLTNSLSGNAILGSGAIMNLNSGSSVRGTINGDTSNSGSLNINNGATFTNSGAIGNINSLADITLASGGIFNLGNDVSANTISVGGIVNFGSSARNITGNIVGTGSALIDFSSGSHVITGDFTTVSGNSLGVLTTATTSGNILATGIASIDTNTLLLVTISDKTQISNGTSYSLISGGTSSTITAISDANINVNSTGTNSSGGHTFTTSQVGNNLFLLISSAFATTATSGNSLVSNISTQNAYNNITQNDNAQGQLLQFQQYLTSSASDLEKNEALKSVIPQTDNSANVVTVNIVNASVNIAENHLESLRSEMPSGFSSGDELKNRAVWVQGFGSSVKQGSVGNGSDGYKSDSRGISLGTEKEFINSSNHIGLSGSYANSKSNSNVGQKYITLNSYQTNLYGGSNFGQLFIDGVAGFSWNEFSSRREIPSVGAIAQAKYSGQTYIGRIKTGWMQKIGKGFTVTPVIMATYAQNEISDYDEKDAGALNLHVNHNRNKFFEGRVGTVMEYIKVSSKGYGINPQIRISYGRDFINQKQDSKNNFSGQTTSFQTEAPNVYQGSWKIGGGINILDINSISLNLDYNHETKHNYSANSGSFRLKYDF